MNTSDKKRDIKSGAVEFPQFPGEDCLAHTASTYQEQLDARLTGLGLLAVAQGHPPASVGCIIDQPLDDLPALDPSHRDFNRREEARSKAKVANAANAARRTQLTLEAWTEVYTLLKISTEVTAPALSRELLLSCDLGRTRKMPGGYFDGPRAYRIILHKLHGGERSETDKDFYRAAERVQRMTPLADGCSANDYSKKALAFLVNINPNLPQPYESKDVATYLIQLMPKSLRESGRRIKTELIAAGRLEDHMYVISKCRELVQEEQKGSSHAPALALTTGKDLELYGLASFSDEEMAALERATGIAITTDTTTMDGGGGGGEHAFVGGDKDAHTRGDARC